MSAETRPSYPSWLPLLLGFLTATGPVSTDMYVPAFPSIEADFGLPLGSAQVTLAAWFFGLGLGQLTLGALSDRFGRRTPLLVAIAIYTLTNAGCALAPDIETLTAMRLICAFAGAASMVIPIAVVRDLATGYAATHMMSQLILVRSIVPIIAPSIGSLLLTVASWRMIFWSTMIYGGLCLLLVAFHLPDTLPVEQRVRQNAAGLARRYGAILTEKVFLVHAAIYGGTMFILFAFIGASPAVFIDGMGLSPRAFALVFSACTVFYLIFSQLNTRFIRRFGASRVMRGGIAIAFAATVILAIVAFAGAAFPGWLSWWMPMPPLMAMMGTQGFTIPNATIGGMHPHAANAGSASALMGMIGFSCGGVSGLLAGTFSDGTARGMAGLMLFGTICMVIADWRRRRMLAKG